MRVLLRILIASLITFSVVMAQSEESLVPNYEFDDGMSGWWVGKNDPAEEPLASVDPTGVLSGENALMIEVGEGGDADWQILAIAKVVLDTGKTYKLEFLADATAPMNAGVSFAHSDDPWENYSDQFAFTLGDDMEFGPFLYTNHMPDAQMDVKFFLGGTSDVTIWLDAVVVLEYDPTTPVGKNDLLVQSFALDQNYPNPFNPETRIAYQLPERSDVNLTIFDLNGRKICSLVQEDRPAGSHTAVWNGTDDQGRAAASGMYLYQITAVGKQQVYSDSKKMLLIR
jgi:hypothetical protein